MHTSLIQILEMSKNLEYIFLTSADSMSTPHLSIVQFINMDQKFNLKFIAWLCPYTLKNLQENARVTIVVWDPIKDMGFQLLGEVQDMQEVAELDIYALAGDDKKRFAQFEWKVIVHINKVLSFQKSPCSDVEVLNSMR